MNSIPEIPVTPEEEEQMDEIERRQAQQAAQQPPSGQSAAPSEPSSTAGMNLGERIAHVGGRENAQGYVEFGSPMAVNALIRHALRDLVRALPAAATVSADAILRDAIAHGVGAYVEIDGRQIHIPVEVLRGEQPADATVPADPMAEAQARILGELKQQGDGAWQKLFWRVACELKCLPSAFVSDNEHVIKAARAALAAPAAPQEPEWIDDPHDIEQGMMRNPKYVAPAVPATIKESLQVAAPQPAAQAAPTVPEERIHEIVKLAETFGEWRYESAHNPHHSARDDAAYRADDALRKLKDAVRAALTTQGASHDA